MNPVFSVFETRQGMTTCPATWDRLRESLAQEPYLVQPLMPNHPDLAGLCESDDAVTVRVITEAPAGRSARCYAAVLEIPGPMTERGRQKPLPRGRAFHIILPIDRESGETLPWDAGSIPRRSRSPPLGTYARAENRTVPFWAEMKGHSIAAHEHFRDVYAIAWDYVVTDQGPFLLEGNTGWGTLIPQLIHGGLLAGMPPAYTMEAPGGQCFSQ